MKSTGTRRIPHK